MKTSKQTKRAISVGLITAAWVVIVAAATLFCGVTAARADEPDNRIDWRWGRPGVMVVTNAPTAVAVTNIAATVATEVAGGVAENLFGPRVTALEGGTNNWNTAFSWGDHAGLYKASDWFPTWAEVTGKPDLFDWNWDSLTNKPATFPPSAHTHPYTDITDPPWLTEYIETDEIALSRITTIEGGTNNWNTAYSWGDHAGLYRAIGWVPSWGDLTDIPQDFPPSTHEHDYTTITNPPWLTSFTETDEIALSRVTVLEGKTNNWNAAFGWGDHADLYKGIGWFPTWAEVTGKPDLFDYNYDSLTNKPATFPPSAHTHPYTDITDPPWLTSFTETDEIAISRVTVLEGKTNNWNAAFGWGDHAGLYKGIGWFPTWTEVTGKPATFPPETHQHDYTAITNPPWLEEYTETDPIWTGVSNTVTVGAALGATAVQVESDPVATPLLSAHTNNLANPHGVTAAQLGALTNIPPLDAVLAAGNVTGGSIAITDTFGGGLSTELYEGGLLVKINGDTMLDVGIGGTGGIRTGPWGGIYLGDDPVVYGISVNGAAPMHGDVALSIVQAESDPVAMAALAGYQSAAYWPPDATASSWFTYTTNANEITVTDYNIAGGTDVIIPDYINGWPVTTIGANAFEGSGVTSIGGAGNVVTVEDFAFANCSLLASVSLPQLQTVGDAAFANCSLLASVPLPHAQTVGAFAFGGCGGLASVPLPQVQTVGDYAFSYCTSLTSLYFDNDAPTIGDEIFAGITPANQVTNYVTNPQATGWGEKFADMPVVRLDLHGREIYKDGLPVATEAHVAQAIAGKVDAVSGLASNLWLRGETIVSDSYTNLWWRNVYSNGWHWLVAYTNAPGGGE